MNPWPSVAPPDPRELPVDLAAHPRLSQWIAFPERGRVAILPGKVEIGQGILTALAQIAAEELDVGLVRIAMVPASTDRSPDEGVTSGSLSVQQCGLAIRMACADARALLLDRAAERLGTDAASLRVQDGTIVGPGNLRTDYWDLAETEPVDREVTGEARPKPAGSRIVSGTNAARIDLADKVFGRPRYIQDMALPGLLHGRVVRPERPGATLEGLDEARTRALPGVVAIVRDGDFLGIVAETADAAERGAVRLARDATWTGGTELPDEARLCDWLRAQPVETTVLAGPPPASGSRTETGNPQPRHAEEPAPRASRSTHDGDASFETRPSGAPQDDKGGSFGRSAEEAPSTGFVRDYSRPYIAHGSVAPSCALAWWDGDTVRVWSHSQGVFNLRADLALVLKRSPESIVVTHAEGAGCYGHNGADDVALDAVLLARAVPGRPMRVSWSRADELARSPVGPAASIRLEASLDETGAIAEWSHAFWSNGAVLRPGRNPTPVLLAAGEVADGAPRLVAGDPPPAAGGGSDRNAIPPYDLPRRRVTRHRLLTMPVRTSSLRSLGAFGNVFAIESFMDELAAEAGQDPLDFRLRHLSCPRGRAVLERAAQMGGWGSDVAPGSGRGLGFARYKNTGAWCAAVAEVEADETARVRRLWIAVDVGEAVNPDGVINQIEGGAVQATSWTLKEAVRFNRERVTSDSWDGYPILRFSEVPEVEVAIMPRPDDPPLGAGEAAHGPVAGAIGNALAVALGVRVRHLPLTRDRILAAMEDAA